VHHAAVVDVLAGGATWAPAALALLALAGLAFGDALGVLLDRYPPLASPSHPGPTPLGARLLWVALSGAAVLAWPSILTPAVRPVASLLFWTAIVAVPVVVAERRLALGPAGRLVRLWHGAVVTGVVLVGAGMAARYAALVRPHVEGIDFYFYVCVVRDLASGATDLAMTRYWYFPGAYTFWRAAFVLGGGSLDALQWVYLGVLGLNAAAVGLVAGRACGHAGAGVLGALWYLTVASRLEGLYGQTEPIMTLPVLLGLLAWGGVPLAGGAGVVRAAALGLGLALALYVKQQGGLLALGWLALLGPAVRQPASVRGGRAPLLMVPLTSMTVFLVLMLLEGHGLEPLRRGLAAVITYERHGDIGANLRALQVQDRMLNAGAGLAAVTFLGVHGLSWFRPLRAEPWVPMLGFTTVAGFAALIQFAKRAYLHYALLAAPFLIIAALIAAVALGRILAARLRAPALTGTLALGLAALPVAQASSGVVGLVFWPPGAAPLLSHGIPWRLVPEIVRDLQALRPAVREGEDVLVLPPRRSEVHLLLGTRAVTLKNGYRWAEPEPGEAVQAIRSGRLDAVLVLHGHLDESDALVWTWFEGDAAVAALPAAGFRVVRETPTMTLWRPSDPRAR
jgi:hypothetical protein